MTKARKKSGFSLIEVLVFISILILFFVTAAAVVTVSIRNMKINEHKIIATHYAEELLEWLRNYKDEDWTRFNLKVGKYCFNGDNYTWPSTGECTSFGGEPQIFKREVDISALANAKKDTTVVVRWDDAGREYYVRLHSAFSLWEK